jgi:hypothetical protein
MRNNPKFNKIETQFLKQQANTFLKSHPKPKTDSEINRIILKEGIKHDFEPSRLRAESCGGIPSPLKSNVPANLQELMNNCTEEPKYSSLPNNNYPQVPSNFTVDYGNPNAPNDQSSINLGRGVSPNMADSVNMSIGGPHRSGPNESIIINHQANFPNTNKSGNKSNHINTQTHLDIVNNSNWGIEDPKPSSALKIETQYGSGMILEDDKNARYETITKPDGTIVVVNRDEKYKIDDNGVTVRGGNEISICPDTGISVVGDGGHPNVVNMELYNKNQPGMSMVPEEPELRDSFFDNEKGSMVV